MLRESTKQGTNTRYHEEQRPAPRRDRLLVSAQQQKRNCHGTECPARDDERNASGGSPALAFCDHRFRSGAHGFSGCDTQDEPCFGNQLLREQAGSNAARSAHTTRRDNDGHTSARAADQELAIRRMRAIRHVLRQTHHVVHQCINLLTVGTSVFHHSTPLSRSPWRRQEILVTCSPVGAFPLRPVLI